MRSFLLLILSTLFSACSTVAGLTQKLDSKSPCCTSPSEFKYEPLAAEKPTSFALNDESPVYVFAQGKSYFKAFTLPQPLLSTRVRVRSFVTGSAAFESQRWSQAYCPQVTFLDAHHQVIASASKVPVSSAGKLSKGFSPAFMAEFRVPPTAQYLVLHANSELYGTSAIRHTRGGAYMAGSTMVMERGGEPIGHPCSPIADADVELL